MNGRCNGGEWLEALPPAKTLKGLFAAGSPTEELAGPRSPWNKGWKAISGWAGQSQRKTIANCAPRGFPLGAAGPLICINDRSSAKPNIRRRSRPARGQTGLFVGSGAEIQDNWRCAPALKRRIDSKEAKGGTYHAGPVQIV